MTLWDLLKPVAAALGFVKPTSPPRKSPRRRQAKPTQPLKATGPQQHPSSQRPIAPTKDEKSRPVAPRASDSLFVQSPLQPSEKSTAPNHNAAAVTPHLTPPKSRRKKPPTAAAPARSATMQDRYDEAVKEMLAKYNIKVRKWRKSMSGIATLLTYRDGTTKRLLESPRPKSPLSMAIFLHEIGHHAIGIGVFKPRCLEEFKAWEFSLNTMRELGLPVTDKVQKRMQRSMEYAVAKAARRGIRSLPPEVQVYAKPGTSESTA